MGKHNFGRNLIQDIICDYYELDASKRREALDEALLLYQKEDNKKGSQTKLTAREARLVRDKVRELRLPKMKEMQRRSTSKKESCRSA